LEQIVLASFGFGPARSGWIDLTIRAGAASDEIRCSHVYDPFAALAAWATQAALGFHGCVEIEEEGPTTQVWLTREPGSRFARLQVFEDGEGGRIAVSRIDAVVDVPQLAGAFLDAFRAYAASYDPEHWDRMDDDPAPAPRGLAGIDLRPLASALRAAGLHGPGSLPGAAS
jgi:hypothetical protein